MNCLAKDLLARKVTYHIG